MTRHLRTSLAVLAAVTAALTGSGAAAGSPRPPALFRSFTAATTTPVVGAPVTLHGRLSTERVHVLRVETNRGRGWHVRAVVRARSSASARLSFSRVGPVAVRMTAVRPDGSDGPSSRVVALTVRPRTGSSRAVVAEPPAGATGRAALNAYRVGVGVAPVGGDSLLDVADTAAALCLVASGQTIDLHALDVSLCPSTIDRADASGAAARSVVLAPDAPSTPALALARIEAAPFHALALTTPSLSKVGFGYAQGLPGRAALVVDVTTHLDGGRRPTAPLITAPPEGWSVPGTMRRGAEWPDPLDGCPSVGAAAGPAVSIASGVVAEEPTLRDPLLERRGATGWATVPTSWCTLRPDTYTGATPDGTARGRGWMQALGATILIPTSPLPAGWWRVRAIADGHALTLTFRTT